MKNTQVKLVLRQPVIKSILLINGQEVPFVSVSVNASCNKVLTGKVELLFDEIILEGQYISMEERKQEKRPVPPSKKSGSELRFG